MRVLIAYASKYGTTEDIAARVRDRLPGQVDLVNLKMTPDPPVEQYDVVLVGGSIYAGRIRPEVTKFCERHQEALTATRVGVFISCLYDGEQGGDQIGANYPGWLLTRAFGRYNVGGAVQFSRLRLVDRIIMQKVAKVGSDRSDINEDEIDRIVADVTSITGGA
ncbi:MAG: flavodoxin domain-containing protein [Spirochaetia bacterium]